MARRTKDDGTGCLILIIIGVVLILLPLVPIIFGIIALINWFKFRKKKKQYPNKLPNDFWLDEREKERFKEISSNIPIANNNVVQAKNAGERENVSKNMDGSFSNRSNRGKEINKVINENQSYIDDNLWRLQMLEMQPIDDWTEMQNTFSSYFAPLYTIGVWFITFYITFSQYFKKPLLSLSEIYSHYINGTTKFISLKEGWETNLLIALGITAGITLISYFILKKVGKMKFKTKYPKPEKVTKENIDDFSKPLNVK